LSESDYPPSALSVPSHAGLTLLQSRSHARLAAGFGAARFGMISCGSGEGFGSAGPMNDAKRTVIRTMVLIQLSQVPGNA
jgi:hypothetical protein